MNGLLSSIIDSRRRIRLKIEITIQEEIILEEIK